MITLDEFVSKYTGKGIDYDGHYGFQCQDLYRMYVKEVLGFPQSPSVTGAKDNWDKYLPDYYERIPNTPEGVPQKGDIIIWGSNYGPFGHVAVCTEATVNTFKCFSQNDPTGALPAIKWYKSYAGVLGWLRPIQKVTYSELEARVADLTKEVADKNAQISNYVAKVEGLTKKYEECNTQRIEAEASANGFRKQFNDFVAQLAQILGTRQEIPEIIASIETAITYEDKAAELDRTIALERRNHVEAIDILEKRIAGLESDLLSVKKELQSVKDTQPKSIVIKPSYSVIIDIIRKLFGGK